ncbi:putative 2-dehydropantoate 2-reductase [Enterobacter hormaechei subsp. hoffmannii]|nr:putative 2-dehydropantoate 2-reductase [Enterobacter hormaechei subsp. hoffmannii]
MSDYPTIALIGPGAIGTTIAAVRMTRAVRRCCAVAPRIRYYACVTMRMKLWCPVRYSPIPPSLPAP